MVQVAGDHVGNEITQVQSAEQQAWKFSKAERKREKQRAQQGTWHRCTFYLPKKGRYCAQQRSTASAEFCSTHMVRSLSNSKGRRVPCPMDPKHTVFEGQVAAHVKVCNSTRLLEDLQAKPYYCKGINSGGDGALALPVDHGPNSRPEGEACEDAVIDETYVLDLIQRVSEAHKLHVGELEMETLEPPGLLESLRGAMFSPGLAGKDATATKKGCHMAQQVSLVGHMIKRFE
ncbi:unnamed protein product [Discosporangium mesarthrocarpum]